MTALSNNPYFNEGYLDNGHTTSSYRTTQNDNKDNLNQATGISFPVTYHAPTGRIKLNPPFHLRARLWDRCAIYSIKNKKIKKSYIGKTANVVQRLYAWNYVVNHPEISVGKSLLAESIRAYPNDCKVKILEFCDENDIEQREDFYIQAYKAKKGAQSLFNKRRGGGGGRSSKASTSKNKAVDFSSVKFPTSTKLFRVKIVDGEIQIPLSPKTQSKRNAIYEYRHIEKPICLIGSTTDCTQKRKLEYESAFRNEKRSKTDGIGKLKQHIVNSPNKWGFSILCECSSPSQVKSAERAAIAYKINEGMFMLNCNRGGGGPIRVKHSNSG